MRGDWKNDERERNWRTDWVFGTGRYMVAEVEAKGLVLILS